LKNVLKSEFVELFENGLFVVEIDGESFDCVVDADWMPDFVTLHPYRHLGEEGEKVYRPSVIEDREYGSWLTESETEAEAGVEDSFRGVLDKVFATWSLGYLDEEDDVLKHADWDVDVDTKTIYIKKDTTKNEIRSVYKALTFLCTSEHRYLWS
jgi:hypothetical protein